MYGFAGGTCGVTKKGHLFPLFVDPRSVPDSMSLHATFSFKLVLSVLRDDALLFRVPHLN